MDNGEPSNCKLQDKQTHLSRLLSAEKPSADSQTTSSMSQRRLALNIPVLQRHLSFTAYRDPAPLISLNSPPTSLLPLAECLTPITPADQIIHTPLCPPQINRLDPKLTPTRRTTISRNSLYTSPCGSSPYCPSSNPQSPMFRILKPSKPSTQTLARRPSLVAPPDASPVHMPRRLSYSRAFANIRLSPISSKFETPSPSCTDTRGLDSPLTINTPRWTPAPTVGKHFDVYFAPFRSPPPNTSH